MQENQHNGGPRAMEAGQQRDASLAALSEKIARLKAQAELRALQENPVEVRINVPDLFEVVRKNGTGTTRN